MANFKILVTAFRTAVVLLVLGKGTEHNFTIIFPVRCCLIYALFVVVPTH